MKTAACQGSARKSSFFLACEGKDLGSRMSDLHAVKPGLVSQKKEYFLRSTLTRLGATGKVKVISTSGAKLHFQLKQNTCSASDENGVFLQGAWCRPKRTQKGGRRVWTNDGTFRLQRS